MLFFSLFSLSCEEITPDKSALKNSPTQDKVLAVELSEEKALELEETERGDLIESLKKKRPAKVNQFLQKKPVLEKKKIKIETH
ncbi:MAG: hypothetical protein WD025_03650 [Bacteriovoracaceae bacterium]